MDMGAMMGMAQQMMGGQGGGADGMDMNAMAGMAQQMMSGPQGAQMAQMAQQMAMFHDEMLKQSTDHHQEVWTLKQELAERKSASQSPLVSDSGNSQHEQQVTVCEEEISALRSSLEKEEEVGGQEGKKEGLGHN